MLDVGAERKVGDKHILKKCTGKKQSFYFIVFRISYCIKLGIISVSLH